MRFLALMLLVGTAYSEIPGPEVRRAILDRLGKEADLFETSAYRVSAKETLRQTLPPGIRVSKRGVETKVPERTRELVSDYGYVPVDERGGSLKEVRIVRTIDGLRWSKGKKGIDSLARSITATDDRQRRRLLEEFENYGLEGVVSDASQLILLFARGHAAQFEFNYDGTEEDGSGGVLQVYRFDQIDGEKALHVYEGKAVLHTKLRGKVWARASDYRPLRIGLESAREVNKSKVLDVMTVSYQETKFGFLLPIRVYHQQFENGDLNVTNDFVYSEFKEMLPAGKRR